MQIKKEVIDYVEDRAANEDREREQIPLAKASKRGTGLGRIPRKKKDDKKKNKKKKKRTAQFSTYIYKVLKKVHPEIGISKNAMVVMNSFIVDLFDRLAMTATEITRKDKKITMSSRQLQTATKIELDGELSKHAISEGTKAINKYISANQ